MAPPVKLLSAPAAVVRHLMLLHVVGVLLARQLFDLLAYLLAAATALGCALRLRRCTQLSMVLLYTNCRGGYHSDLRRVRSSLERTVEAGAPSIKCAAGGAGLPS